MSDSGKQSPLGVNVLGSLLQNVGFRINPIAASYMGSSKNYTDYPDKGSIVNNTSLRMLTYAIKDAYTRGQPSGGSTVSNSTYDNLISIGANTIPALGNSKPPTFTYTGPANQWDSQGTTSGVLPNYQGLSWNPYNYTNAVTQWGFIRLLALQAWNEFNWNGNHDSASIAYKDFTQCFAQSYSFIEYTNVGINALKSAPSFLKGTYSNMNDLITADVTGVSLATNTFGQDLIALGKAINLQRIDSFGLPSVLLGTLKQYNAISQSISLSLIAAGLQSTEVDKILSGAITPSIAQEQKIYGAFLIIQGVDLENALIPLNCKTRGLTTLADLLDPVKLFPNSYLTLTVPIFNASPGPTNSKTYYFIYGSGTVKSTSVNTALSSPAVIAQTAGPQIPLGPPPVTPREIVHEVIVPKISAPAPAVEITQTPIFTPINQNVGSVITVPAPTVPVPVLEQITDANAERYATAAIPPAVVEPPYNPPRGGGIYRDLFKSRQSR